jgi:o-succinylbenzoate synthase
VRIVRADVTPVEIVLAAPLATAHGTLHARSGALLSLTAESGARGWGEALPLAAFGLEAPDTALAALACVAEALVGAPPRDLDAALAATIPPTAAAPSARAAADFALHDLAAQAAGIDLATLLNRSRRSQVELCALLTGHDAAAAARAARSAVRRGFRTLKLKLGAGELDDDVERVAAVRAAVGAGTKLRLDANGAWESVTAGDAIERLARFDVELIEEPLRAADLAGLAQLRGSSPIAIAADESVRDEVGAQRLLDAAAVDVLVLKPAALGGLRPTLRIAAAAKRSGVGVLVTGFLDSTLGIAAALHCAAAVFEAPYAAGLATAGLLASDLAAPLPVEKGSMALPAASGLGVVPDAAALRRCASGPTREFRA